MAMNSWIHVTCIHEICTGVSPRLTPGVKFVTSKLPYKLQQKGGLTDLQTRLEHYTCSRLVSQSVCWVFEKKPKDGMGGIPPLGVLRRNLKMVWVAELIYQSLASLGLLHDSLLVVLPQRTRQLVVVHRWPIL